jgi:glutaminase
LDGSELYCEGDHDRPFALQSFSKVFAYSLAPADNRRGTSSRARRGSRRLSQFA